MKRSRLYLVSTLASISVLIIITVIAGRLFGTVQEYVPERPTVADLSALENFTSVSVRGDFALEVYQQADFSVEYQSVTQQGSLSAEIVDSELRLVGFGNRGEEGTSLIRIGMPSLGSLATNFIPELKISNFTSDILQLDLTATRQVALLNNDIGSLQLTAAYVGEITLSGNSIASQQNHFRGDVSVISDN